MQISPLRSSSKVYIFYSLVQIRFEKRCVALLPACKDLQGVGKPHLLNHSLARSLTQPPTWSGATAGCHPPSRGEDAAEDVGGEEGDVPLHLQQVEHQSQEDAHGEEHGAAHQQVCGPGGGGGGRGEPTVY